LSVVPWRKLDVLLVGLLEWPWLLKVTPPRKPPAATHGRFKACSIDYHRLLMADADSNQIFIINHTKGTKEKIAGCGKAGFLDGPLDVCRMNGPCSIAVDPSTHYIYVADRGNHRIRRCDMSTGFMSTVCGNGCRGCLDSLELDGQMLDSPYKVTFCQPHYLMICCADNSVRKLDLRSRGLETVLIGC
jgi:DNA-binding beta-propeller fold protein YncE